PSAAVGICATRSAPEPPATRWETTPAVRRACAVPSPTAITRTVAGTSSGPSTSATVREVTTRWVHPPPASSARAAARSSSAPGTSRINGWCSAPIPASCRAASSAVPRPAGRVTSTGRATAATGIRPGPWRGCRRAAGEEVRRELGAQLRRQRAGTGQPVLGEVERHPGLALDDPAAVSADRERAQVQNGPALLAAGSLTALAARALMVLELCQGRDRGR